MAALTKRALFRPEPGQQEALERLKQSRYQDVTDAEMLRRVLRAGLDEAKRAEPEASTQD